MEQDDELAMLPLMQHGDNKQYWTSKKLPTFFQRQVEEDPTQKTGEERNSRRELKHQGVIYKELTYDEILKLPANNGKSILDEKATAEAYNEKLKNVIKQSRKNIRRIKQLQPTPEDLITKAHEEHQEIERQLVLARENLARINNIIFYPDRYAKYLTKNFSSIKMENS